MRSAPTVRQRGRGVYGYRPDAVIVQKLLRGRRAAPVHSGLTVDRELWVCVQYVTNDEMGITHLRSVVRVARQTMVDILAGWGIDRMQRRVIPLSETERRILEGEEERTEDAARAA